MNTSNLFINRPVFTIVISLLLVVLGILGFYQLELRAEPSVFQPQLSINVNAPGSSAQFVEKNITIPLENAIQTTPNLFFTSSDSSQDNSQINVYFKNITPEEFLTAQSAVLQAVNGVQLPSNAATPEISTANNNGQQLMIFAVSDAGLNQHSLVNYVQNNIVHRLEEVPGVGNVQQYAALSALRVNLNPIRMAELNISVTDVLNALKANNISAQAGAIVNAKQTIPINLESTLNTIKQFKSIIIKQTADRMIRLKDIANITIAAQNLGGSYYYYDGQQGTGVGISAANDANPILVGKTLRHMLVAMQKFLPPGMQIHMLWDESLLIKHSVEAVFWTILESVILVSFVTFLFLGRWRFAIVPVVTIPICIIASFCIMWFLGFSINLMTLLALVLGVGLVVDDAIVVLENCHRHVEAGLSTFNAAIKSMKEITFPVIGMTIAIIAVYVPTAFMRGKTAIFFQQFAFTLAGAVAISGIVALTLTPMMCARLLSRNSHHGYDAILERVFMQLKSRYQRFLIWVLKNKWLPISLFSILLITGLVIFKALPSDLIPAEYGGYVFFGVQTNQTASVAYTEKIAKEVMTKLLHQPSVENIMSRSSSDNNFGVNIIKLKPQFNSYRANVNVANAMNKLFPNMVDADLFAIPLNVSGEHSGGNEPGQISSYIIGFASYKQLAQDLKNYAAALTKTGIFAQVRNELKYNSQQIDIYIKRNTAAELGINISAIETAISTYLGGYNITNGFQFNGVNYPVVVQLPEKNLQDLQILHDIYVPNSAGQQISINRVVTVSPSINLPDRSHINGMRAGQIVVTAKPKYTEGQAVAVMQSIAEQTLPPGINLTFSQHELNLLAGNSTLSVIFLLGLVFIYLILAALFESFIDPLIILLTVPLCIVGALLILYCIGGSLNIYTGIGLVTLIGLVSKHGVLITQFANDSVLTHKRTITDSIIEAASIRIRPILMTSITMIVGAIPLVISSGVGSNGRSQLGWVIIVGLVVGTFFSLFIVPVAYVLLKKIRTYSPTC